MGSEDLGGAAGAELRRLAGGRPDHGAGLRADVDLHGGSDPRSARARSAGGLGAERGWCGGKERCGSQKNMLPGGGPQVLWSLDPFARATHFGVTLFLNFSDQS